MPTIEPFSYALRNWQNFYNLLGTAAATLTGLMFIAITFGSGVISIKRVSTVRAFTTPVFTHFIQVFILSAIASVPNINPVYFGAFLSTTGMLRLVHLIGVHHELSVAHKTRGDLEFSDWMSYIVVPGICYILAAGVGINLSAHPDAALNGLAIFCLTLLLVGIYCAWELILWMAIQTNSKDGR